MIISEFFFHYLAEIFQIEVSEKHYESLFILFMENSRDFIIVYKI